jgi:hypothetical protein
MTPAAMHTSTVCCHAAGSITPIPSGDGQINGLTSFIAQAS